MRYLLLILLLAGPLSGWAQQITGRLIDTEGAALAGAAVMRLSDKDSSMIEGTLADDRGRFTLRQADSGSTLLRAQAIGQLTRTWRVAGSDAGTVALAPKAAQLKEVVVTKQRPLLEMYADKMVVNVEGSINAQGNTALDVLRKSPGVVVDKDDNLQLRGKSSVRVLIDGKPSALSGQDLAAYLKSLQSTDIDNIELITNPSAKYEASGAGGVINIRLKKNRNFGTNGSASGTFANGVFNKWNEGINLNNRTKRLNLFSNLSGWQGHNRNTFNLTRKQADSVYQQSAPSTSFYKGFNYKAGGDYYIDSKNTVGIVAVGGNGLFGEYRESKTLIAPDVENAAPARTLTAPSNTYRRRGNITGNLNYRFADTSGHELTADLDYGAYSNGMDQHVDNQYRLPERPDPTTSYTFYTRMPVEVRLMSAKTDYEQKLWGGSVAAGARVANVRTTNDFNYYDAYSGAPLTFNTNRSNFFSYTERVTAGYGIYKGKAGGKVSYQAGLRLEHTLSQGDLTYRDSRAGQRFSRNYLNAFPSGGLTYNPSQAHSFSLTYSSRIDRPNYQSLNPFEYSLDQLTSQRGNDSLTPQYTRSVELSHNFKGALMTSVGYSYMYDIITMAAFKDKNDPRRGYVKDMNLSRIDQYLLNISSPTQIGPWWQGNVSISGQYSIVNPYQKPDIMGLKVVRIVTFNGYAQQVFTLMKGYKAEISGWYNSPNNFGGTSRQSGMGGVDVGLQKNILADRGNIKIAFTDVFHTMRWGFVSNYNAVYQQGSGRWESQQIRVSFNYRFGSDQIKGARNRKSSADDLGSRVK